MAEPKDFDEILSNCLAALERGEGLADVLARYPQEASELKPLLEAAVWFEGQKAAVEPRPGFIRASRSRLIEKIEAEPVAAAGGWLEQVVAQLRSALGGSWRVALQLTLAAVLLACLVLTGSEAALASQGALPGDVLYSVKLGLERVELLVTLDPAHKIELHNQFAQARLVEIQELVMEGRYNYIREAVSNFEAHVEQASQLLSALAKQGPRASHAVGARPERNARQPALLPDLLAGGGAARSCAGAAARHRHRSQRRDCRTGSRGPGGKRQRAGSQRHADQRRCSRGDSHRRSRAQPAIADPYPGAELNPTGDFNRHKYRPDSNAQPHPALHRHGDAAADAHLYAFPRARQTDADIYTETAHLHAGATARENQKTAAQPNAQTAEGQ